MPEIPNVVTGETIESEWGNAVRDRAVMRYATVLERTTLHPSPVEGDLAYMEDSNTVLVYNGTAWGAIGTPPVYGGASSSTVITSVPTSFVVGVTTTFTKPAAWVSYQIMAWGSLLFQSGTPAVPGEARLGIAGSYGTVITVLPFANSQDTMPARHQASGLTADAVINIEARRANTASNAAIRFAEINYIATRLT